MVFKFQHTRLFFILTCTLSFFYSEDGLGGKQAISQIFTSNDYTPIGIPNEIPQEVINCTRGNLTITLPKGSAPRAEQIGVITSIQLRELFLSNHIYYGDTMTAYVRKVFNKLLKNDPALCAKIHPFVTRFPSANAITWEDGTILVNVGLLRRCRNEAQLAFVLGHELTHFRLNHSLQAFLKDKDEPQNSISSTVSHIPYSDDAELIADSLGLILMREAGYNPQEAIATLELLDSSQSTVFFNIAASLSSSKAQFSKNDLCRTNDLTPYMAPQQLVDLSGKKLINLKMRISHLRRNISSNESGQLYLLSEAEFSFIKKVADYENIENSSLNCDFLRSVYESLSHLQQDSSNLYFARKASESLVEILNYAKNGSVGSLSIGRKTLQETNLAALYCFLNRKPDNEIQQIAFGVLEKLNRQFGDKDEDMAFHIARAKDIYNGLDMAISSYRAYQAAYPKGKHIAFVENRLNPKK